MIDIFTGVTLIGMALWVSSVHHDTKKSIKAIRLTQSDLYESIEMFAHKAGLEADKIDSIERGMFMDKEEIGIKLNTQNKKVNTCLKASTNAENHAANLYDEYKKEKPI